MVRVIKLFKRIPATSEVYN